MGKDIGRIYKKSQYQLSNLSFKAPVSSSSESQKYSAIELRKMYVPSAIYKNKIKPVLYSQNNIQNDATNTNNDNIQSCETQKNHNISTISTLNNHSKRIASISSSILNYNITTILPPVGK